ncbi:MAG: pre-peptidase C-terminal domain-containing protein [Chloroflexi bacterium]|nr:pre-peptidase C-terminal domain-containing protein [Chloroflexota bacterium]
MSKLVTFIAVVLGVLTFGATVFAQEAPDETLDNGAFAFDYPSEWIADAFLSTDENGTTTPVIFLYSSTELAQMVLGGRDAADLPEGEAVIYLTSTNDGMLTVQAAMDELIAQEESAGAKVGSVGEIETIGYEGYIASTETSASEGFIGVLGSRELRVTFITLAASGDLVDYQKTFEAVIHSIRPSERNADDAGNNSGGKPGAESTAEGNLPLGEAQPYTFEGSAGQVVTIVLESDALTMDPFLNLYASDGSIVAQDDDSAGNLNAIIENFALPADDTYTIEVTTAYGDGGGQYRLTLVGAELDGVQAGTSITAVSGERIEMGATVTGNLPLGETLDYTFVGKAGDVVTITLESDAIAMDPYLELRGPTQRLIAEDDDSAGGLNALIDRVTLPEDGVYTIVVRTSAGIGGGKYTLTLR